MAIEQVQNLPQQYVTDLGADYGKQLAGLTSIPINTDRLAPQLAGQNALQTQASSLAGSGVGAYQPYLNQAGAFDTTAGTQAGTAAGFTGPQGYNAFTSPYQQDVINETLAAYDAQAGAGITNIGLNAAKSGNLGGGREGVMRANYQTDSDLNRALLQAKMLNEGFTQSNQFANQAFNQNLQLSDQYGQFGDTQRNMANQIGDLQTADINQLGKIGGLNQLQDQAVLDQVTEQNRLETYEPYERLNTYGSGVASLFSGNAPFGNQSTVTPNPTPLQTALGTGSVLSGIFGGGSSNRQNPYTYDGQPR